MLAQRHVLTDALKRQFEGSFTTLARAIRLFDDPQWRRGDPVSDGPYNGAGRAAVHALLCAEFYTSFDDSVWTRFGKDACDMGDGDVPTPQQALAYLDEARAKTMAWIDAMGDEGMAAPRPSLGTENATGLDWAAYALRHLQHHAGELCGYLKQQGRQPAAWR